MYNEADVAISSITNAISIQMSGLQTEFLKCYIYLILFFKKEEEEEEEEERLFTFPICEGYNVGISVGTAPLFCRGTHDITTI